VRLERAPPRRPVVPAARSVEVDGIPLRRERLREDGVVRVVLLVERTRDRRRDRTSGFGAGEDGADEAIDPVEPRKPGFLRVGSAAKEASRLQKEPGQCPGLTSMQVQERQRAEAHPEADAPASSSARQLVEFRGQRRRASRRRRKGVDSIVGAHGGDVVRRYGTVRGEFAEQAEQRRSPHVVDPVENDEVRAPTDRRSHGVRVDQESQERIVAASAYRAAR
jgi:hypothetical protein